MFKENKTFKLFIITLILILSLGVLSLIPNSLKAQPAPGFGGSFIENQIEAAQDANFWIEGHGKFGPDDSNYLYFDPEVLGASENSLYVNSVSGDGNFIKLEVNNQEKFKVDKEGNLYMNNLYVNNIVGELSTIELDNYLYNTLDEGYHPYFVTVYQFPLDTFPANQRPSGSGRYIFVGAIRNFENQSKIYIIKQDNGEIVSSVDGYFGVAGLGVTKCEVMFNDYYYLFSAISDSYLSSRSLRSFNIMFNSENNYEPDITMYPSGERYFNNGVPFYILPKSSDSLYITDDLNKRVVSYNTCIDWGDPITASIDLSYLGVYSIHSLAIQSDSQPGLWVAARDTLVRGSIIKLDLSDLSEISNNTFSDCPHPDFITIDGFGNTWFSCSNAPSFYSQTTTSISRPYIIKLNSNGSSEIINVPYYESESYQYGDASSPYGIYYNSALEQILVGNRKDGRIYRFSLAGDLINCNGSIASSLDDLQACIIADGEPIGFMISSSYPDNSSSFWTLNMSSTNPSIYLTYPMETLYIGDLYASGHVASFGNFVNDSGVTGAGQERLLFDLSGYNDKINFVGYQTNVGQDGDRAEMYFFGDNATGQSYPQCDYDLGNFIVQSEVISLGPNYNGQAIANAVGTTNKGQLYLRGMTTMGIGDNFNYNAVQLASGENLLYGVIDSDSAIDSYLIKLETKDGETYNSKFKVDKDGNTTIGGEIKTVDSNGQSRLWGEGRPGVEVTYKCTQNNTGIGVGNIAVQWESVTAGCPVGTWVCTDEERGSANCGTGSGTVRLCDGSNTGSPTTDHYWLADRASADQGKTRRHNGGAVDKNICFYMPVWCCWE